MRLSELFGRHPVELSSKDSCAQPYVDVAAVRICYRSGWRGPQRERGIPELAAIVHLGIGGFFVLHSPTPPEIATRRTGRAGQRRRT